MRFYTVEKLGAKRARTPEGFLVCSDAVLARTGEQVYAPGETPIDNGDDMVVIEREPDEVFRPETIASAAGKPFCDEHPSDDVTPANYRDLARGHILNPHQGAGDQSDLLLGDLVVTDPDIIAELESEDGRRELSCGYDADYEETGAGRGKQKNIVINHVALVESGRCGARCSIRDRSIPERRAKMANKVSDLLRRAFKAKDEKELEQIEKEAKDAEPETEGTEHHVHVHLESGPAGEKAETPDGKGKDADPEERFKALEDAHRQILARIEAIEKKLGAQDSETEEERKERERKEAEDRARDDEGGKEIEGRLEEEAPPGTGDAARKARDSSVLADSFQETMALAEIIAPGIKLPTFDRTAKPKATLDAICALRERALDTAMQTDDGRSLIRGYLGGRSYDEAKKNCSVMRGLFLHVGGVMRQRNADAMKTGKLAPAAPEMAVPAGSPASWNEQARQLFAGN